MIFLSRCVKKAKNHVWYVYIVNQALLLLHVFAHVLMCVCVSHCGYNACVFAGAISEEHKELQRLHSCKIEEHEGVVLKLQSQLKNAQAELDQVRSTLRTLQGADGHGEIQVII